MVIREIITLFNERMVKTMFENFKKSFGTVLGIVAGACVGNGILTLVNGCLKKKPEPVEETKEEPSETEST